MKRFSVHKVVKGLQEITEEKEKEVKPDFMRIQLLSNDSSLGDAHIRVPEGQIARDAIQAAYATLLPHQMKGLVVCMGGDEIDMESSFEANGIEGGARLEVWVIMLCLLFFTSHCAVFFLVHVALLQWLRRVCRCC